MIAEDLVLEREHELRMTIARLLDAVERYPSDLQAACEQGRAALKRVPLGMEEN